MRETTQNFLVGLTSIVAIIGFAYVLMRFGELDRYIHPRYSLVIHTDHAAGLRPGSLTEFNGVPIGVVDDVTVDPEPGAEYPVSIFVLIDSEESVPRNISPYSITSLFGGSATLALEAAPLGNGIEAEYYPTDGTAELTAVIRFKMIEQFTAELDARMQPVIEALDSFKTMSETYTTVGENINALITPEEGAEPVDLRQTVENFNNVLAQVDEALRLAQEWLGDEQMRADLQTAVSNANDLIGRAADTLDRYTRLADELEADADEVVKGLLPITDEIAVTLEEVRRLTRLASEGEGTVARLMNNPDLYNSLEDAAVRLERTLVEIQLYVEKIKAEGLDIDF